MGDTSVMVFDIIGTYFVKTYWTSLYDIACTNYENKRYKSLEDAYIGSVDMYNMAVSKREHSKDKINKSYVILIKDLFRETKTYIPQIATLADFIDFVMRQLVPTEYFSAISHQSTFKESMFRNILREVLTQFSLFVVSEEIEIVLNSDERKDNWSANLKLWQEKKKSPGKK